MFLDSVERVVEFGIFGIEQRATFVKEKWQYEPDYESGLRLCFFLLMPYSRQCHNVDYTMWHALMEFDLVVTF